MLVRMVSCTKAAVNVVIDLPQLEVSMTTINVVDVIVVTADLPRDVVTVEIVSTRETADPTTVVIAGRYDSEEMTVGTVAEDVTLVVVAAVEVGHVMTTEVEVEAEIVAPNQSDERRQRRDTPIAGVRTIPDVNPIDANGLLPLLHLPHAVVADILRITLCEISPMCCRSHCS